MALVVENGTGVAGADSYSATASIDAYWAARLNNPLAAAWAAASDAAHKEGAAREATAYIDATWGPYYLGTRKDYVQGLMWPRLDATDGDDLALPALPPQLLIAVAMLAARALSAPLAADIDMGARVKTQTKKIGPLEKSTEYFDSGSRAAKTSYGAVAGLLAPILNGSQPDAPAAAWNWS